ncbi:putative G-protein coupled receptor 139 [Branchiostoma floridae x Branchiostoma japonicum]
MATEATSIEWDFLDNDTAMFNDTAGMPHVMRGPSPEFLAKAAKFNLFYNIMTYFILVIGVPGNVLSFVVMMGPRLRKAPSSLYLAALAVVDTIFLLTSVGLQILHDEDIIHASDVYCKLTKFLVRSSGYLSAWITTAFTVERYIAVCHPMRRSALCTMDKTRKVLLGMVLVVCSVSCLEFWAQVERENMCVFRDPQTWLNITIYDMTAGRLIPTAAVGVINIVIVIRVLQTQKNRQNLSKCAKETEKRQNQITVVLFTVSTTFFLLTVPQSVSVVYDLSSHGGLHGGLQDIDEDTLFRKQVTNHTLALMFKLNFSVNFILYCVTGRRFREAFLRIFCRCLPVEYRGGKRELLYKSSRFTQSTRFSNYCHAVQQQGSASTPMGLSCIDHSTISLHSLHPHMNYSVSKHSNLSVTTPLTPAPLPSADSDASSAKNGGAKFQTSRV